MNILHEINQLEMGGVERVVAGIIKHDKKNNHSVYSYKDGSMRKVLEDAGAIVHIETEGKQDDLDIDIIHIHTGGQESHIANATKGSIPTIETVHSPVVSAVRDEYIFRRVGVSNVVTKLNRKCETIYNGIDFDRIDLDKEVKTLKKEQLNIPNDAFVVGRLGRIGHDKCLEEWLVACKKFQDAGIVQDPYFLIVGDEAENDPCYLSKIKVMAGSLPLNNCIFLPSQEAIGYALSVMDIFLYPSPTEGFGLVYMEAMAAGVATILWDSDLTRELAYGAAYLTPPTVKGLFEALCLLGKDKFLRDEYAMQGQDNVRGHFGVAQMADRYVDLYDRTFKACYPQKEILNATV